MIVGFGGFGAALSSSGRCGPASFPTHKDCSRGIWDLWRWPGYLQITQIADCHSYQAMILGLCSKTCVFLRNKVAWLDPDRQQLDWASRGILKPIQWVMKPKVHSFDHQLQLILRTRLNSRHTHCFVDEDGVKHLKSLAVRHPSVNLEAFILRASRLRMKLSAKKMASLRRSSARRSSRWKKHFALKHVHALYVQIVYVYYIYILGPLPKGPCFGGLFWTDLIWEAFGGLGYIYRHCVKRCYLYLFYPQM